MGVIQSSINSGLSVAQLLYTQSASFAIKKDEKQRQANIAIKEKQFKDVGEKFGSGQSMEEYDKNVKDIDEWDVDDTEKTAAAAKVEYGHELQSKINDELMQLGSEDAINRTAKSVEYRAEQQRQADLVKHQQEQDNTIKAQEALAKAQKEKKQRNSYLNIPTNMGGMKLGELLKNVHGERREEVRKQAEPVRKAMAKENENNGK